MVAQQGPRRQSLSLQLPAAHRRCRDRRRGGGPIRRARRVFLPQAALHAAVLSGDPRLPRIRRLVQALKAIRAPRSICASSRPRISASAASSSSAARRPCASNCSTASSGCASGICWRCCISARCRPSSASKNIDLFCREVLPHLQTCGTTNGTTAGGPSACKAKAPPPPPWPPRPERAESCMATRGNAQAAALAGPGRDRGRDRAAAGRRWFICTGLGALRPTATFSRGSPPRTRSMRRNIPAPAAAIPKRRTRSTSWLDLVVYYGELFDALELVGARARRPFLRRHGRRRDRRGQPSSVRKLVLIDPVGLWRDDHAGAELDDPARADAPARALRRCRRRSGASASSALPDDPAERVETQVAIHLVAGLHRQVRLADRRPRL